MYESFFELSRRPFASTPDTSNFFPSAEHEEALALLKCCVNEGEGVGVLLGAPGTGKTLLCHLLLDALAANFSSVFLNTLHTGSVTALLQAILYDLGQPYEGKSEQELRLAVTEFMMGQFAEGSRTLIFVDEAQNLSVEQLEELRLLTNLEGRREKAVQVLLFGQPSLADTLDDPRLESLGQRIAVLAGLSPFNGEQAIEYIRALVKNVGGSADSIFTANALCEICERSDGIPRRINQLCHRTLLLAFAHESGTVDAPYVEAAATQLFINRRSVDELTDRDAHHSSSSLETASVSEEMIDPVEEDEVPSVVEVGAGLSAKLNAEEEQSHELPEVEVPSSPQPKVSGAVSRMRQLYNRSA